MRQRTFFRRRKHQLLRHREFAFQLPEDRTDAHIGILKIGSGIALKGKHLAPGENVIGHPVLREFGVFHRPKADRARDLLNLARAELRSLFRDDRTGTLDRLVQELGEPNRLARTGPHDLAVFAQDAAEGDMLQIRSYPHLPGGSEDLLKMERLRSAHHVPDRGGIPAADAVFDRGEIRGRIEKSAITFANDEWLVRKRRNFSKEYAKSSLADFSHTSCGQPVTQWSQRIVVKAFAQPFVEANSKQIIELLEFAP